MNYYRVNSILTCIIYYMHINRQYYIKYSTLSTMNIVLIIAKHYDVKFIHLCYILISFTANISLFLMELYMNNIFSELMVHVCHSDQTMMIFNYITYVSTYVIIYCTCRLVACLILRIYYKIIYSIVYEYNASDSKKQHTVNDFLFFYFMYYYHMYYFYLYFYNINHIYCYPNKVKSTRTIIQHLYICTAIVPYHEHIAMPFILIIKLSYDTNSTNITLRIFGITVQLVMYFSFSNVIILIYLSYIFYLLLLLSLLLLLYSMPLSAGFVNFEPSHGPLMNRRLIGDYVNCAPLFTNQTYIIATIISIYYVNINIKLAIVSNVFYNKCPMLYLMIHVLYSEVNPYIFIFRYINICISLGIMYCIILFTMFYVCCKACFRGVGNSIEEYQTKLSTG